MLKWGERVLLCYCLAESVCASDQRIKGSIRMTVEESKGWPPGLEDLLEKTFDELTEEEHERITWAIIHDQFKKELPSKCRSIGDVEAWLDELRAWSMAEMSHVETLKLDVKDTIDGLNETVETYNQNFEQLVEIVDSLDDRLKALEKASK